MLKTLRRVVAAATPGPLYTGDADRATSIPYAGIAYTDEVYGDDDPHTPIATYELAVDAARAVAVANAWPALLAVADAARALEAAMSVSDAMERLAATQGEAAEIIPNVGETYYREHAALAALWRTLAALGDAK